MQIEVITREDLQMLRQQLLDDIRALLSSNEKTTSEEWLRSSEVRKRLKISPGTLQTLRVNGQLSPTKVNGIYFYKSADVNKMLEPELSTNKKGNRKWS